MKNLVIHGYTLKRAVQLLQIPSKIKPPSVVRRVVPREEQMKDLIKELNKRLILEEEKSKHFKETNQDLRLKIKI